jgi:hypothetical protein
MALNNARSLTQIAHADRPATAVNAPGPPADRRQGTAAWDCNRHRFVRRRRPSAAALLIDRGLRRQGNGAVRGAPGLVAALARGKHVAEVVPGLVPPRLRPQQIAQRLLGRPESPAANWTLASPRKPMWFSGQRAMAVR